MRVVSLLSIVAALNNIAWSIHANPAVIPSVSSQTQVQEAWRTQPATAVLGEAGRVVMTYGESPAALVCAPLHICAIEFGPGEEFHDTPSISDPVRWHLEVREGYSSGSRRQYLILKPTMGAVSAILTAFTDKRFYSIQLVPDPEIYTPVLSFRYPDEELEAVRIRIEEQRRKARESKAIAAAARKVVIERTGIETSEGLVAAGDLNFGYLIAGKAGFAPQRIYDDGRQTYIELPRSWDGELPVFHARSDGSDRVVNYRVDGRRYEIDGVFDDATLRLGKKSIRIKRDPE